MKKYIITTVVIILIFTLFIHVACTKQSGSQTSAVSSNCFLELLGLIPADLKDSPICLFDYASFWHDNDISFSSPEDYMNTIMEIPLDSNHPIIGFYGMGDYITGNSAKYMLLSTIQDKYVGYNVTDVKAEIQAGYLPRNVVAAIGSFNPQATEAALNQQDEWTSWVRDNYVTENYKGIMIHSWGDGTHMDVNSRLSPPHVDALGRAKPFAVSESFLFSATQVNHVKLMIDASMNKRDSLADVPELAIVADGMSTLSAWAVVLGYAEILGYEDMYFERLLEGSGIEMTESAIEEFEEKDQPRLKKFVTFGSGLAEDAKGIYTAIVLVHESPDDAEENVSLLEQRIENTGSIYTSEPWKGLVPDTEIHAEGKVLLAKLYTTSPRFWMRLFPSQDSSLLFYEK